MVLTGRNAAHVILVGGFMMAGQATTAMTATQQQIVNQTLSAVVTQSAQHAIRLVQHAPEETEAIVPVAWQAGGFTMVSLAATAKTATPAQTAQMTLTVACQTMSVIYVIHPVLHAVGQVQATA